jgi:hypothetical protein
LEVWRENELQDRVIYTQSSSTQALKCSGEKNVDGYRLCNEFIFPSLLTGSSV